MEYITEWQKYTFHMDTIIIDFAAKPLVSQFLVFSSRQSNIYFHSYGTVFFNSRWLVTTLLVLFKDITHKAKLS